MIAVEERFQSPRKPSEMGSELSESVPHQNRVDATLSKKGGHVEVKHVTSIVD